MITAKPALPKSETHQGITLGALVVAAAVFGLCYYGCNEGRWSWLTSQVNGHWQHQHVRAALLIMLGLALPIIAAELLLLKTWRRSTTGLDFTRRPEVVVPRILRKLLGFVGTFGIFAFLYWIFPEYHAGPNVGSFYDRYYGVLALVLPWLFALAPVYFAVLDSYQVQPKDGYWHLGGLLMFRWREVDWGILGQHLRGWLVKAFFLPLMFTYTCNNVSTFLTFDLQLLVDPAHADATQFPLWSQRHLDTIWRFAFDSLFFIDVLYAAIGYALTFRILDSHIRSTEPTFLGWAVALLCYQPFWSLFGTQYLAYSRGEHWGTWLAGHPVASAIWGGMIITCITIYTWATTPFGIRFSNLTHRGIFTNGPYRFTKHPAYVSKNLSWWLLSIPFIPLPWVNGGEMTWAAAGEALRYSCLLLGLNTVYFLRARTEERHLSQDPAYCAYAEAMEHRGMFRWVGRLIPALRFRAGRMFNVD